MPFLKAAYFCQDCEWIGERAESCEQCASATVIALRAWINREPRRIHSLEANHASIDSAGNISISVVPATTRKNDETDTEFISRWKRENRL